MSKAKSKPEATDELEDGEQIPLIEVDAENSTAILRVARVYKRAQEARCEALAEEIKHKTKLLATIREAKLHPTDDGCYKFRVKGVLITVTPRDELVKVKEADDETPDDEVTA